MHDDPQASGHAQISFGTSNELSWKLASEVITTIRPLPHEAPAVVRTIVDNEAWNLREPRIGVLLFEFPRW